MSEPLSPAPGPAAPVPPAPTPAPPAPTPAPPAPTPVPPAPTPAPSPPAPAPPSPAPAPAAPSTPPDLLLQPNPGEALIGPKPYNVTVQGVALTVRVSVFLSATSAAGQVQVDARVLADLSDLQQKIGAVIDTIALPTDNCNHFGADNLVMSISGKQITIDDSNNATLRLSGDVDVWACAANPIPCTRVDIVNVPGPFGTTIPTPQLVTYNCNSPVKTQVLDQPFDVTLPFSLSIASPSNPGTLAVDLGTPQVTLGGTYAAVTDGILQIAGINLNDQAKSLLDAAVNPGLLQLVLPSEIQALNLTLNQAQFVSNSGALTAAVQASGAVDAALIGALVSLLLGAAANTGAAAASSTPPGASNPSPPPNPAGASN